MAVKEALLSLLVSPSVYSDQRMFGTGSTYSTAAEYQAFVAIGNKDICVDVSWTMVGVYN